MQYYITWLLVAFGISGVLFVPFINLLYKLKFTRKKETDEIRKTATANFYKIREMHSAKVGVPTGGGILVALVTSVLFGLTIMLPRPIKEGLFSGYPIGWELGVIFVTFVGFGGLGFYDDLIKILGFKKEKFFGMRMRHKLVLQMVLGMISAGMLYWGLKIDFVYIPFWGLIELGWLYFPMATFLVVAMANAFDFTDGLDGLSCGLLVICLLAFWTISLANLDHVLSLFIAIWIGSLFAFLYFNIFPARIMLGNMGGLAFGATLAIIGLLSGKIVAMLIIAGVYLAEGLSSLLQLFSKRFMKRRLFPIAPFHHWLQLIGWEEPKIVARAWLAGIILAIFGTWLAFL